MYINYVLGRAGGALRAREKIIGEGECNMESKVRKQRWKSMEGRVKGFGKKRRVKSRRIKNKMPLGDS